MTQLNEAKLGRVWKMITDSRYSFVIMSAYRGNYTPEENKTRHNKLRTFFRDNGYGYVELRAGYSEKDPDTKEILPMTYEDSLLISSSPSNSQKLKKLALTIAQSLEQDTIIFKDATEFSLIGTNDSTGVDDVIMSFSTAENSNINTDAEELFKEYFSSMKKGSHKGRKFIFNLKEWNSVDSVNKAYMRHAGKFTEEWLDVRF